MPIADLKPEADGLPADAVGPSRHGLWMNRWLQFGHSAATAAVITLAGIARTKWLARHLEPAGIGVIGQVFAAQTWLGVAAGLGLALPLTRAIGAARAREDRDGQWRAVWNALGLVGLASAAIALAGIAAAPGLSALLLGTAAHAPLVRLSMLGMLGYASFLTIHGWFAGRSDVRAPLTVAVAGGIVAVAGTLLLVPRFGLAGGVLGAALFYPAGLGAALLVHRRDYVPFLRAVPKPLLAGAEVRTMLGVGVAALVLALCDQGAMLGVRLHYIRAQGFAANGQFQAAIALSQQTGAAFYTYLAAYAFGTISGFRDAAGMRAYTRKIWTPVTLLAGAGCAAMIVVGPPILRLFYSAQFEAGGRLVGWLLLGEFARIAMQIWALGALPLGGTRLWLSIPLVAPVTVLLTYPAWVAAGAGVESLPLAYAVAGLATLGVAMWRMSRRGVTLSWFQLLTLLLTLAALALLAQWRAHG